MESQLLIVDRQVLSDFFDKNFVISLSHQEKGGILIYESGITGKIV